MKKTILFLSLITIFSQVNASVCSEVTTDPTINAIADAIRGNETGGSSDAANAVSCQGATGTMQIMPGTFDYYSRPPEQFNNDSDRIRAACRKIVDDYGWCQNRAADANTTVACTTGAYLGGRGAINSDGTPRCNVADGYGTTPCAYADKALAKMGNGSYSDGDSYADGSNNEEVLARDNEENARLNKMLTSGNDIQKTVAGVMLLEKTLAKTMGNNNSNDAWKTDDITIQQVKCTQQAGCVKSGEKKSPFKKNENKQDSMATGVEVKDVSKPDSSTSSVKSDSNEEYVLPPGP